MPYKIYSTLDPLPLPRQLPASEIAALSAISLDDERITEDRIPDPGVVARIFYLSAGLTKKRTTSGGEIHFRAAACTGALYHIDLYMVCGDLPGIEAGVYHFGPHDFSLRKLRSGDYRETIREATAGEESIVSAPLVLISTSTYWRNAWKYGERTYRHCYWDNGTILANLLAASASQGFPGRVICGFIDDEVNRLLGLDTGGEFALSLVSMGRAVPPAYGPVPPIEPLDLKVAPVSKRQIDYPAIRSIHQASSLYEKDEVLAWRGGGPIHALRKPQGKLYPLRPAADRELAMGSIDEVIQRRGSTRRFTRASVGFGQFSTLIDRATRGVPADFLAPGLWLNELYLIVHAVDDLPPGAYVFHRSLRAVELLKEGNFRREAGILGLEQELAADGSFDVFFLVDLKAVLQRFGNRGYRAAELEAGIVGGKLYLGSYAERLGASGLTFYDDDVTEFFSPHAAGKSVMFLVAVGRPWKRGMQ